MIVALYVLHIVVCFALILIVLLQTGKGSDLGAAFGGGSSQTLFGSSGTSSVLGKLTAGAAIVFMITCLFLSWVSSQRLTTGVMKDIEEQPPAATKPFEPGAIPMPGVEPTDTSDTGEAAESQPSSPLEEAIPAEIPAPEGVDTEIPETEPTP